MDPNSKPIAWLIRHGNDTLSDSGVFVSWTDVPLTAKGRAQAKKATDYLKDFKIEEIYSSPLQRCLEVAELMNMEIQQSRALLPWNRGILTGCPESEGEDLLKLIMANPNVHIPFGDSRRECEERIETFFTPALERAEKHPAAFFTHHSVIDVLNCLLLGKRNEEPNNLVKEGGVVAIHIEGDSYRLEPVLEAEPKQVETMS